MAHRRQASRLGLAVLVLMALAGWPLHNPLRAGTSSGYDLSWGTVDGGGVTAHEPASPYGLGSTAGQPEASTWTGGRYRLAGGFWGGVAAASRGSVLYLPLVLR